jgi:hypothetical protein
LLSHAFQRDCGTWVSGGAVNLTKRIGEKNQIHKSKAILLVKFNIIQPAGDFESAIKWITQTVVVKGCTK